MDTQLKQRIFGAIIVLALIVIFVPMLFNKHQKEQATQARAIPSFPSQPVVDKSQPSVASQEEQIEGLLSEETSGHVMTRAEPVTPLSAASENAAGNNEPSQIEVKLQPDQNASSRSDIDTTKSQTDQTMAPQPSASVTGPIGKTLAQTEPINTLSSNPTLKKPSLSLPERETAQLSHANHKINSPNKKAVTKKHPEPFYIRDNLANSNNVSVDVGGAKKQKAALMRAKQHFQAWVVQLGTFEKGINADKLVSSLRQQGFTAFTYKNKSKLGLATTKVFVGPFVKKEIATAQLQRLHEVRQQNGFVTQFDVTQLQ